MCGGVDLALALGVKLVTRFGVGKEPVPQVRRGRTGVPPPFPSCVVQGMTLLAG